MEHSGVLSASYNELFYNHWYRIHIGSSSFYLGGSVHSVAQLCEWSYKYYNPYSQWWLSARSGKVAKNHSEPEFEGLWQKCAAEVHNLLKN